MSAFNVFVLPEAEAEITATFSWYHQRNPQAADAFRAEHLRRWHCTECRNRRQVAQAWFDAIAHFDEAQRPS